MSFRALVVNKPEEGPATQEIQTLTEDQLPEADVTVAVEYSTLNYKDGLCITTSVGLVRKCPHVPGIDFARTLEASDSDAFAPGDKVVLTGWRVGEVWWGGYSQKARVKSEWMARVPGGIETRQAMAVGTAGFTAMLAIMALENHGLTTDAGPVLVTGAAGGVGGEIAAVIADSPAFDYLDAPVQRISAIDAPAIYSPPLEKIQLPKANVVIKKVLEIC